MKQKASGLSNIKTSQKTKLHTIPKKVRDSDYLDLYLLAKERARLEQEKSVVDRRNGQLEENLEQLQQQIETLQKAAAEEDGEVKDKEKVKKKTSQKEWKTMTLEY